MAGENFRIDFCEVPFRVLHRKGDDSSSSDISRLQRVRPLSGIDII